MSVSARQVEMACVDHPLRRRMVWIVLLLAALAGVSAVAGDELPWRQAGLTERQAAAHLLSRFTFGARPGDIDRVLDIGLETWFEQQLDGQVPEADLDSRLASLTALDLPLTEYSKRFPPPGMLLRQAQEAGVIPESALSGDDREDLDRQELRRAAREFAESRGYRPQRELLQELTAQKVLRAVYAENQLAEVLTDFWFNHFNVALSDGQARPYILAYERDAIRPHVLGDFPAMLRATARHPAMLFYLDNARSTADENEMTTLDQQMRSRRDLRRGPDAYRGRGRRGAQRQRNPNRPQGLNENYARELLELHTLGVDGGYSQQDVVEVARAFTGWTALPPGFDRPGMAERMARARQANVGFVFDNGFLFRADAHDAGEKTVLGHTLPAGRGIEDGEDVLDLLVTHPATAAHLARKLAVRFISDDPPESVVNRLAETYRASDGDVAAMLEALVSLPEFWSPQAVEAKIKTPFELSISALRALDANVQDTRGLVSWIERMGQPLYNYPAPTGFPDEAGHWVNAGNLLNRMNFSLALAAGGVPGVSVDVSDLLNGHQPESREAALSEYLRILLPTADPEQVTSVLEPMIHAPDLVDRVEQAAPEPTSDPAGDDMDLFDEPMMTDRRGRRGRGLSTTLDRPPTAEEQVVGVILGSPQFQRR